MTLLNRPILRPLLGLAVMLMSGWYLSDQLRRVDWAVVWQVLAGLGAGQIVLYLGAVLVAFVAVAGQERAIVAHLGLPVPFVAGGRAAIAAASVSQLVGFGPVVGAVLRRRLMTGLTLPQSFAISAGMAIGFFASVGVLALCSLVTSPEMGLAWPAAGTLLALAVVVMALVRHFAGRNRWMPNLLILGRFLFWCTVDLGALALTLWLVLPGAEGLSYLRMLPVFLVALGMAVASGSPGGLGPFEAAVMTWLPQISEDGLVAGIVMFRVMAYLVPAALGALWLLLGRAGRMLPREAADLPRLTADAVDRLPLAEAHLTRQGEIGVMAGSGGWLWLTGRLPHVRLMLGDPAGGRAAALTVVDAHARAEGRVVGLYKIRPRMAVLARRAGFHVVPVASEAVLNPQTFTTAGPARARLRRKLSHARKAGLQIDMPARLPYDEMDLVARDWSARHGGERGFSMGRWDAAYVVGQRVVLARRPDGGLVGFVTFHAGPFEWALDLVRFAGDAPDGTIFAMLCHALDQARTQGVTRLSLAAIPAQKYGLPPAAEAMVHRLFQRSSGLAQFKQAFAPQWEPRYMAARGWAALALVAAETSRAVLNPRPLKKVPYGEFMTLDGGRETPQQPAAQEEAA